LQDDIRFSATTKKEDIYFDTALIIALVLFCVEIMVACVVVDDYKYSFFFYLDIVATLSIIFDVPVLLDAI
jgi:hypothetical protein